MTTDRAKSSSRATTALILGIAGLVAGLFIPLLGLGLGVGAILTALNAREEIRTWGWSGAGLANAGLVLGIVGVVLSVVWLVLRVASLS